jgi:hypothetical protein
MPLDPLKVDASRITAQFLNLRPPSPRKLLWPLNPVCNLMETSVVGEKPMVGLRVPLLGHFSGEAIASSAIDATVLVHCPMVC